MFYFKRFTKFFMMLFGLFKLSKMAISMADIIANGIPGIAALHTWLTGIVRRDLVVLGFRDKAGLVRHTTIEKHSVLGAFFDAMNIDLLNAISDAVDLSSAEFIDLQFVSQIKDFTPFDPDNVAEESNCKEWGKFYFQMQSPQQGSGIRSVGIPSIKDTLILPGGKNLLNTDDPLITDFAGEFTGIGLPTRTFMIKQDHATSLVKAKREVLPGKVKR